MRVYVLQASIGDSVTSQAIPARDDFGAKVLAVQKVNQNYASDKRYNIGKIVVKDPTGAVIYEIEQEKEKKK